MAVRVAKVESIEPGKRVPVRTTLRCYLRPVALRACGGNSDQNQKFLRESRYNLRVSPELLQRVPGLFHVTTEQAWGSILREGLKAGADLVNRGRQGGRCDIHLLTSHPVSDKFKNERLRKMRDKNYTRIVLVSLVPEAIDLSSARINQQGVILQRTPIPPVRFDCLCGGLVKKTV